MPGAEVIALGEHVDYWNHGGWADRFSSHRFSARQNDYANAFRKDTVYTPQMIVDGQAQFVGSDEDAARAAIAQAARQPKAQVSVTRAGDTLSVRVDHLPASAKSDPAEVVLAITEGGLSSSVGGGENAGRRLGHTAVVRQLTPLGTVSGGTFTAAPSVKLALRLAAREPVRRRLRAGARQPADRRRGGGRAVEPLPGLNAPRRGAGAAPRLGLRSSSTAGRASRNVRPSRMKALL